MFLSTCTLPFEQNPCIIIHSTRPNQTPHRLRNPSKKQNFETTISPASTITTKSPMTSQEPAAPWHAAYPTPKATAVSALSKSSLLSLLQEQRSSSTRNFLVVDLRKADHEVTSRFGRGAPTHLINMPLELGWRHQRQLKSPRAIFASESTDVV